MHNLTPQKVCLFLISLGFFIASPWLISEVLGGNPLPVLILFGLGLLFLFLFVLKDRCWMIIPFCLSIEGNLNFLPLNFSMQEVAVIAVLAYILLQIIMGRQIKWKLGPAVFWLPLAGLLAVLMYHWVTSGDIGIRALGGGGWGGRKYYSILMASLTLPLIASFSGSSWRDFQAIPLIYFLGTFVDLIPNTLSTLIPAVAPYIYKVYSSVNVAAYGETLTGNFSGEASIARYYNFARLGTAGGLLVLCYFPMRIWLDPSKLWILPVLSALLLLCAMSGFRAFVFNFILALGIAGFASARFKVLFLLPIALAGVFALSFSQGALFNFPLPMQRALSFLPGDWDAKAKSEAEGSSKWRNRMRDLFYSEYFSKAPFLGTGYGFDPDLAKRTTEQFLRISASQQADEWADVRGFIEMKQPHEGDVHAILVTGLIGTFFFVLFCFCIIGFSLKSILSVPIASVAPIQIWASAILVQQSLSFFTVFGDLSITLAQLCPVAAILASSLKFRPKATQLARAPIPLPSANSS
jgi:hypothetical protein